jgi:hypothetical protein
MKSKTKPKVKSEVKKKEKKTDKKNNIENEKTKDPINEINSIKLPQQPLKKKSSIRSGIKNNLTSAKSVKIVDNQSIKEEEKSNLNFALSVVNPSKKYLSELGSQYSKTLFDNNSIYSKTKNDDLKSTISKSVKSKKSKANSKMNDSNNNTQNESYFPHINFNSEVINEKRTKDALKRLLKTSTDLVNKQNGILAECDELTKNVNLNDLEIEKLKMKQDYDNFPELLDTYSKNLNDILNKLKNDSKEVEEAKKLREENKSLKYKIEMLSIDKSDEYLDIENKLVSTKNLYVNEINSMISYLKEIGLDRSQFEKISADTFSEDKVVNFFTYIKKNFRDLKNDINSLNEKVKYLTSITSPDLK